MNETNTHERAHEVRIDVTRQTPEELALAARQAEILFKFNHTMPGTAEHNDLIHALFPSMGAGSRVSAPLTAVRPHMVNIGKNVVVMPGYLMMSAGGITISDGAMIAANVQLISNNHDLYERQIITCRPIHIGRNAWIGAGATILPGVTVGDNAVVGAASVVTKDVEADTIVAGNPARLIKRIPPQPECSDLPDNCSFVNDGCSSVNDGCSNLPDDDTPVQLGLDSCGD